MVINLQGNRFGMLTVISRAENSKHHAAQWVCKCDCGKTVIVNSNNLRTGHSTNCGCMRKKHTREWMLKYNTTHGQSRSRLYTVWMGIRARTNNPKNSHYKHYGGRGIKICEEWMDFPTFREWALSTGYKEDAKYGECTIDRINVDGDYEPSNCRWVDLKIQANNKRKEATYGTEISTHE